MAHSCPTCGQACYCQGDIDDILLDTDEAVNACDHCDEDGEDGEYQWTEWDERASDEEGGSN